MTISPHLLNSLQQALHNTVRDSLRLPNDEAFKSLYFEHNNTKYAIRVDFVDHVIDPLALLYQAVRNAENITTDGIPLNVMTNSRFIMKLEVLTPKPDFGIEWLGDTVDILIHYTGMDGNIRGKGKHKFMAAWYNHKDQPEKAYYVSEEKLHYFDKLNIEAGKHYQITSAAYKLPNTNRRWMWLKANEITQQQFLFGKQLKNEV